LGLAETKNLAISFRSDLIPWRGSQLEKVEVCKTFFGWFESIPAPPIANHPLAGEHGGCSLATSREGQFDSAYRSNENARD
jgi:hypothetical protein